MGLFICPGIKLFDSRLHMNVTYILKFFGIDMLQNVGLATSTIFKPSCSLFI